MTSRVELIKERITRALAPTTFELTDESQAHAGHAGARESGGGHFSALIVSNAFDGKTLVQRHQLVYQTLGDLMQTDIHAFSMKVNTPQEYQGKKEKN